MQGEAHLGRHGRAFIGSPHGGCSRPASRSHDSGEGVRVSEAGRQQGRHCEHGAGEALAAHLSPLLGHHHHGVEGGAQPARGLFSAQPAPRFRRAGLLLLADGPLSVPEEGRGHGHHHGQPGLLAQGRELAQGVHVVARFEDEARIGALEGRLAEALPEGVQELVGPHVEHLELHAGRGGAVLQQPVQPSPRGLQPRHDRMLEDVARGGEEGLFDGGEYGVAGVLRRALAAKGLGHVGGQAARGHGGLEAGGLLGAKGPRAGERREGGTQGAQIRYRVDDLGELEGGQPVEGHLMGDRVAGADAVLDGDAQPARGAPELLVEGVPGEEEPAARGRGVEGSGDEPAHARSWRMGCVQGVSVGLRGGGPHTRLSRWRTASGRGCCALVPSLIPVPRRGGEAPGPRAPACPATPRATAPLLAGADFRPGQSHAGRTLSTFPDGAPPMCNGAPGRHTCSAFSPSPRPLLRSD